MSKKISLEEHTAARSAYNTGEIDGNEYAKRVGHTPHMGGLPLTSAQLQMLEHARTGKLGASGLVEYPCASAGQVATAKALKARGLLGVWWMATRLFAVRLTVKGRTRLAGNTTVEGEETE
jgi:hypothetical protein